MLPPALQTFINSVDSIVRRSLPPAEIVRAIEPRLAELVKDGSWLGEPFRRPIPAKAYAQYLLHRPDDHAFSLVSFVWNPLNGSPIHDHCTWGVIGQLDGEEEETRFKSVNGRLETAGSMIARPGDVAHVYPPNRDIHQISNRTNTPTISIHVYGGDIGSQQRHAFDPATGESRPFVSGYDSAY